MGGVGMGGLPLVISIVPAEAVAEGEVSRALLVPIASAELLGAAALLLAAAAAAAAVGHPPVVAATAAGLVVLAAAALGLRRIHASATG
ncbi:hypothetical protein ER308_16460 [Egibacter rhizosphaerae]|uniref:Uncharacterized protein n=1 Tax=Egibacter rhizosphaerae TaxID=1670831 RepID=A0A411YIF1_9ACTN|nr:hypothetical protein [Egibacter rhizosphaerae]QBI21010.1 hypothetical protein ER308_16460 [Egibacter rhizosphaerae]